MTTWQWSVVITLIKIVFRILENSETKVSFSDVRLLHEAVDRYNNGELVKDI